jgi:type II secretory ATPase GspE/PulE/Tfp pilus assembly ATPase PilB-like protein
MVNDLIDPPAAIAKSIAFDINCGRVYVDRRLAGDPMLLTWIDRNRRNGHQLELITAEIDDISRLRTRGMRLENDQDISLAIKNEAISIIRTASQYRASDLHIMARGSHAEIQIVVDGGLRALRKMSHEDGISIMMAIYQGIATTKDSSFNPLEPQNAQIGGEDLPADIEVTSIRIVRGPCHPLSKGGSFMTMRLQYSAHHKKSENMPALMLPRAPAGSMLDAGLTADQVAKLRQLIDAPNGLVIFTGPTGSGKTTTLYQSLMEMARTKPYRRQVTVEDPIEYPMDWAVQLVITNARTVAETAAEFAAKARVMLRMAPNVIQLGELRDADVAITALEMSVTGHQVWTTLHVTDPFLAVDRLELMDAVKLNRKIFCDHKIVRGIIAQRLLPKLCPHCSKSYVESGDVLSKRIVSALRSWGSIDGIRIHNSTGCARCGGYGTAGRFAVAEIVVTNASLMADFIEHGSETARKNYRKSPGSDPSMLETAIKNALSGVVDPRHIEDCIDLIEDKTNA